MVIAPTSTSIELPVIRQRRAVPWFALLLALIVTGALGLRLPRLAERPIHTDEAVQARKTGDLLETGVYRYDPREFHGPSLYYLTLPFLRLAGVHQFAEATEIPFRLVPVAFGVGLILLLALVRDGLGWPATLLAGVFTALSPAMVFYSRYYVQEMLLVFFSFALIAAGWRYRETRAPAWAVIAGVCAGLMHATKETSALALAAMLAALALTLAWAQWRAGQPINWSAVVLPPIKRWHLALAAAAALVTSGLFYTSFLTYPRGLLDAFGAVAVYFNRGAGGEGVHNHPWDYYFRLLLYTHNGPGPRWSEGLIVGLAAIGFIVALAARGAGQAVRPASVILASGADPMLLRFLAFYTLLLTLFYAAIPYKTPWNALGFLHGMILLAGVGAVALWRLAPRRPLKLAVIVIIFLFSINLGAQARRATGRFAADRRNPYVYAHTAPDTVRLASRVHELAALDPAGLRMLVEVYATGADYWPLPWYLRDLPRVGYWNELPSRGLVVTGSPAPPVVIASQDLEGPLDVALGAGYHKEYYGLRPGVLLALWARQDLWERFVAKQGG